MIFIRMMVCMRCMINMGVGMTRVADRQRGSHMTLYTYDCTYSFAGPEATYH